MSAEKLMYAAETRDAATQPAATHALASRVSSEMAKHARTLTSALRIRTRAIKTRAVLTLSVLITASVSLDSEETVKIARTWMNASTAA